MLRESIGADGNSLPLPEEGLVMKGQFTMNFKPDCRAGSRLKFQIAVSISRALKRSIPRATTNIFRPST
jgi:hypothetical protein